MPTPDVFFSAYQCTPIVKFYRNGRPCLCLVSAIENDDIMMGEPIATASVNLPECEMAEDEIAIKDYSENEGMASTLFGAGFIEREVRYDNSSMIPIYRMAPRLVELVAIARETRIAELREKAVMPNGGCGLSAGDNDPNDNEEQELASLEHRV